MKTHNDKIRNSGYIENSDYEVYLQDIRLLTDQMEIEQENELNRLAAKIRELIDSKFEGNKIKATNFYKLMNRNS
ncbi:hypothetical protein [Kordia sp.]|uniref:hypothetical protein n=1 Tax=Kordia sp. TaxID=1965332 RepID=UPI003D2B5F17